MIPIGLALAWAGYTITIWGYCLIKDYNVTPKQLFATTWPGSGSAGSGSGQSAPAAAPTGVGAGLSGGQVSPKIGEGLTG